MKSAGPQDTPRQMPFPSAGSKLLGHIVSAGRVSPDPSNTSRINKWPTPKSVLEVQQFLDLANHYRYFIKDFATIAKASHQATEKKHGFKWTKQCAQAFNQLKNCLTSPPISDWTKPFILDTDACEVGIGAVSSQCDPDGNEHVIAYVIAYVSRLLTRLERNYCVTRKELLAVVTFLNHFRHYLIGIPSFIIQRDHGTLTWL